MCERFFRERVRFVFGVADEVCHEENSLHIFEFHHRSRMTFGSIPAISTLFDFSNTPKMYMLLSYHDLCKLRQ
jgi:hypothetical protein